MKRVVSLLLALLLSSSLYGEVVKSVDQTSPIEISIGEVKELEAIEVDASDINGGTWIDRNMGIIAGGIAFFVIVF
jgi:hypothetical protein